MNRETRDKFASRTNSDVTSGNALWETSPAVFAKLSRDFGPFDVDLCADPARHLCATWFGPGSPAPQAQDALTADWTYYGRTGFANPPYGSFINRILPKAIQEAKNGFASTFLLPLRGGKWFKDYVLGGASGLWLVDRRLVFFENGEPRRGKKSGDPEGAMFDSIVVQFVPGMLQNGKGLVFRLWEAPLVQVPAEKGVRGTGSEASEADQDSAAVRVTPD
jgi:hypothetical protein